METVSNREWRIWEILRETFLMIKSVWKLCLPLCLLVYIPVNIIELFIPPEYSLALILLNPAETLDAGLIGDVMFFAIIIQLIRLLFTCLVAGGYTYLALSRFSGKPVSLQGLMDFVFSKWLALAYTGLLFYMIIIATFFLIIPAIYFAVIFVFHLNMAAVSGERGFRAMIGSARLVRGAFIKRLIYGLVFVFMQGLMTVAVGTFLIGLYPPYYAYNTIPNSIIIVSLNVLTESLASVFLLAQTVWFTNVLMSRKALGFQTGS